ncbi:MAG: hypothetical protein AAFR37_09570, partial [Cyanobacteria bacterium J06628_3]
MGLATIPGGQYEISHVEGMALAGIVPPPMIDFLDWNCVDDVKTWLISEFVKEWEIFSHWLVSYRTRAVNTKQLPFTSPDYLDQKSTAKLYSVQLDLCGEIWESVEEIQRLYSTPHDWWVNCMLEVQRNRITEIFENPEGIPKGDIEDDTRQLIKSLKKGDIPFDETEENIHLYRVFKYAIKLKSLNNASVKEEWGRYLEALKVLPRELKKNKELKSLSQIGNRVCYRDRNTLKPIPIKRVPKEVLLDSGAKFAVLVPEDSD